MRICSVTVLYHPNDAVYKNICSYYDFVEKLYIIDNTEAENKNDWIKDNATWSGWDKAGKIVYVRSGINTGVAAALNSACRLALADGFDWILTMDQDSNLKALDFFKFCKSFIHDDDIGIISASFSNNMPFKRQHLDHSYELLFAITSGNLLRLNAWSVTVFNEKLFIDEVDNDFCLRLKTNGFKILSSKEILLNHSIGEIKKIRFFPIKREFSIGIHSPVRTYYITRNTLYVVKENFFTNIAFCLNRLYSLTLKIVLIILFYPQRLKHLKYHWKGVQDFFLSRYGKFQGRQ